MGHTPYGYSIENGCATIKEDEANKIRKIKAACILQTAS